MSTAGLRQANCYYSSSDAAFADRYEARAEYARVATGRVSLEGGWRVYSSGAGIALGLIFRHFLGFRREAGDLVVDPVMPSSLDGLTVRVDLLDREIEIVYRVGKAGCGVGSVSLNGYRMPFTRESNPHRRGAVRVSTKQFVTLLQGSCDRMTIELG